jgi:hypothetical protein
MHIESQYRNNTGCKVQAFTEGIELYSDYKLNLAPGSQVYGRRPIGECLSGEDQK